MGKKREYKLSAKSTIFIFGFNITILLVFFLLANYFVGDYFSLREVVLTILLASIMNGYINYRFILLPLWDLEEQIDHHKILCKEIKNRKKIYIEDALLDLIKQLEFIREKENIEEKQRKKTELYALQTQINPHFLYNSLESIRGYALLHDMDEISDITEALSRVFRNMISNKKELLTLKQEFDNISNYMKIQQFRFNNKFQYSIEADNELLDKVLVPRMTLQPLVENAIMHGLEAKKGEGWVKIKVCITEKKVIISVTDNGVGISEERMESLNRIMRSNLKETEYLSGDDTEHSGIALVNIHKRIKLYFGEEYGLVLRSVPQIRTTSEIVLPIIMNRK